jgi:methylphosphotriester-DNA--protein-cysteine methyltransferase
MARTGRPKKEFDLKTFQDLVGLGCNQEEICWYFRDETGKPANIDTLTRWCKRTFNMTFQEYFKENGFMAMKIQLRKNQFELSKRSAAMAIWLGKQYLDQKDSIEVESSITDNTREEIGVLIDELNKTRSGTDTDVDTV